MRLIAYILSVVSWIVCAAVSASEPVIGGPCEGCELVFVDQPADIRSHARIAPVTEPGEPLVLEGTVRTAAGDPAAGVVVYAYHTNAAGVYPKASTMHGKFRAWARTDRNGNYRFDTIRPGAYPAGTIPQDIHLHIIEPGRATYFIDDVTFDDDPLLTENRRRQMHSGRGGPGETHPNKDAEGRWRARRDIILGEKIPGYERLQP